MNSSMRTGGESRYFGLFTFMLIPQFHPSFFGEYATLLELCFDIWNVIVAVLIIFLYFYYRKISNIIIAIFAYLFTALISTIINKTGDTTRLLFNIMHSIILCMIIEIGIKRYPRVLIRSLTVVLGIECIINSIYVLFLPFGIDSVTHIPNYFLGYDNGHSYYVLFLLMAFLIYANYRKMSRVKQLIMIALFSFSTYITWSASGVVAITLFLLAFLFFSGEKWRKLFRIKNVLIFFAVVFFGLVVLRLQTVFAYLIETTLKKDLTLTTRTYIWDATFKFIAENPIIGVGQLSRDANTLLIGAAHPHNFLLRVMYETGAVGIGTFLLIILLLYINTKRIEKNNIFFNIYSLTLLCYTLVLQVEAPDNPAMFLGLITFGYNMKDLIRGLSTSNERIVSGDI